MGNSGQCAAWKGGGGQDCPPHKGKGRNERKRLGRAGGTARLAFASGFWRWHRVRGARRVRACARRDRLAIRLQSANLPQKPMSNLAHKWRDRQIEGGGSGGVGLAGMRGFIGVVN